MNNNRIYKWRRFPTWMVRVFHLIGAGSKTMPEPATHFGLLCVPVAPVPTLKCSLLRLCQEPAPLTSGTCSTQFCSSLPKNRIFGR